MIVLDTNIISEMMKSAPSTKVISWLDQQETSELFITTITIAEITYGINSLPQGNRKHSLATAFNKIIKDGFLYRVLDFNETAAFLYGKIMAHRKQLGQSLSILDGQIAAIALAEDAVLATRNIKDFTDCQLELVNPFS